MLTKKTLDKHIKTAFESTKKNKFDWALDFFVVEIYYPVYRFFRYIRRVPREIKWFFQRGWRGYADCDVWNVDSYLLKIIPPMLEWHLKHRNYVGPGFWPKGKSEKQASKEWDEILKKMIRGFNAKKKITEHDDCMFDKNKDGSIGKFRMSVYKELDKTFQDGMKLFTKYFGHLWD